MAQLANIVVSAVLFLCGCLSLTGCASPSWGPTPTPSPLFPFEGGLQCTSDLQLTTMSTGFKGMCVDDISLFVCPELLLKKWPNTDQDIKYLRLFKASRAQDSEETTARARDVLARYVRENNIKVLVGSQITCFPDDDERDWNDVMKMLQALGSEHVLGLAVGNELDLLYQKGDKITPPGCLERLWGGYLYKQTVDRINWAREALDNPDLPVTSVFTGQVIWMGSNFPDTPQIKLVSYLKKLFDNGETNFVFSFNFYPIFDGTLRPDANKSECHGAISQAACFESSSCKTTLNLEQAKQVTDRFIISNRTWKVTRKIWIGEIGWSTPQPVTYSGEMASCPAFFSKNMLYQYYSNFLRWNLDGADLAFYFTMRDAYNFGEPEHFGLVQYCEESACKLQRNDAKPTGLISHAPTPSALVNMNV